MKTLYSEVFDTELTEETLTHKIEVVTEYNVGIIKITDPPSTFIDEAKILGHLQRYFQKRAGLLQNAACLEGFYFH